MFCSPVHVGFLASICTTQLGHYELTEQRGPLCQQEGFSLKVSTYLDARSMEALILVNQCTYYSELFFVRYRSF